jgi:hypothetical protein
MRKRKKILATGSIVTTLLLGSTSSALAQAPTVAPVQISRTHTGIKFDYEPGSGPSLDTVAANLGISPEDFKEELRSGKTPKEILEDQGFTQTHIKKLFKSNSKHKYRHTEQEE